LRFKAEPYGIDLSFADESGDKKIYTQVVIPLTKVVELECLVPRLGMIEKDEEQRQANHESKMEDAVMKEIQDLAAGSREQRDLIAQWESIRAGKREAMWARK
jgi:hypothetical protein